MMNENANHLLEGNLERMYFQTKEWIEEIEFYEEELKFLNGLISDRIASTTTNDLDQKHFFRKMDDVLYTLSDHVMTDLKNHRKDLSHLMENNDLTKNGISSRVHVQLLDKISKVKRGIRNLKSALYKYLKNHPFKFDFDGLIRDM